VYVVSLSGCVSTDVRPTAGQPHDALTAERLAASLQLRLVKYADPEQYQSFLDELLQRSTKTARSCDLSIERTRGKL
jgi:hypothetical protein